MDKNIHYLYCW